MPNPNTFDEASAATEEMFANSEQLSLGDVPPAENSPAGSEQVVENPPAEEAPATTPQTGTEEPPTEQPGTETPPSAIEQAAQTAEVAAQVAAEKDAML